MTADERYHRLRSRIVQQIERLLWVHRYSLGPRCPWLFDDLLGVAEVAFCESLANRHKARIGLDEWVLLNTHNAMSNYVRSEQAFRRLNKLRDRELVGLLLPADERRLADIECESSEDGRTALEAFTSMKADEALDALMATFGWRRAWNAVEELRGILGG